MLWFIYAALTGATLLCILWPLRRSRPIVERQSDEIAFLGRQLAELDRDSAQSGSDPANIRASRAEIGRRLIAASKAEFAQQPGPEWRARYHTFVALCLVVLVPTLAFGLYYRLAEPFGAASSPAVIADAAVPDMATMIAQVEAHLEKHPDDGRGYEVLAPVFMRLGRYDDAAQAHASVIRLLGPTAERHAAYGEALFAAGGNIVTEQARTAFEAATALDASHPKARFYLGLAAKQEGDATRAASIWSALLKDTPPDAPWLAAVQQGLADLKGPQSNPQAAAAIAGMAAPEQQAMIRQMVDGLATRLAADGHDLPGWQKLVRAYSVLAEPQKAQAALVAARTAFIGDTAATAALARLAQELGLERQ